MAVTVAQYIQCAMSGRNCSEPVARLRDAGARGHSVAHFLRGLDDPLWLWPEHEVLARIVSKCRCAKRERKHDARTSDRPAAQATWSAYCFHAPIVMRLRMLRKRIRRETKTEVSAHHAVLSIRPKEMLQTKIRKTGPRFFAPAAARCGKLLIDGSGGFPLRVLFQ